MKSCGHPPLRGARPPRGERITVVQRIGGVEFGERPATDGRRGKSPISNSLGQELDARSAGLKRSEVRAVCESGSADASTQECEAGPSGNAEARVSVRQLRPN